MPRSTRVGGRDWGGTTPLRGERGFTLQELMVTIAILGVLIALGIVVFLGILERWRVAAATDALVADMRLAHAEATNGLTDWRVVMALERGGREEGPDYYLLRLAEPFEPGDARPVVLERQERYFPGPVAVGGVRTASGHVVDDQGAPYWTAPWDDPPPFAPPTRSAEFNADGSMRFPVGPSGSVCVAVDEAPQNRVVVVSATSRVLVRPDAC